MFVCTYIMIALPLRVCSHIASMCDLMGFIQSLALKNLLVGLHAKSQLYNILDVEKTRCTIAAASYSMIHKRIQKIHTCKIHCSYIGTRYVRFKAYMYKKKHRPEYTLKYQQYYFCALPKGCNASLRVFYSLLGCVLLPQVLNLYV